MRVLQAGFRDSIEASQGSEVFVIFATITHPELEDAIRVNSDAPGVDYVLGNYLLPTGVTHYENNNTYFGFGFSISLLSDDEQPPQAKVAIANIDKAIGAAVLLLDTAPRIEIKLFARSDWDDALPRNPLGTPAAEYLAPELFLRNISCDVLGLSADIFSYDIATEPWPASRSTQDRLPGLYR